MTLLFQAAFYKPENNTWFVQEMERSLNTSVTTYNSYYYSSSYSWHNIEFVYSSKKFTTSLVWFNYPNLNKNFLTTVDGAATYLKSLGETTKNIWYVPAAVESNLIGQTLPVKIFFNKAIIL